MSVSNEYPAGGAGARPRRVGNKVKVGGCVFKERRRREEVDFSTLRRWEIDTIIKRRHGGTIPETDDADLYFRPMARTVAASFEGPYDRRSWMVDWLRKVAPWLGDDLEQAACRYLPADDFPERHLSTREAAHALRLTYAEREAFGVRTITACDKSPAEMKEIRRLADRDRKRRERLEKGCTPRDQSLSQTRR